MLSSVDPSLSNHQPASYFSDLRQSIQEAENLICITGWAVWDKLHLLRGSDSDGVTLGKEIFAQLHRALVRNFNPRVSHI